MASYTPHQYSLQGDVMREVRWAGVHDKCPVCRVRPRGVWPSGVKRTTCGAQACFIKWLPVRGEPEATVED